MTRAPVTVAVLQIQPRKGDIEANLIDVASAFLQLRQRGACDVVVLPEAALTGYFLEGGTFDLAMRADTLAERLAQAWDHDSPIDLVCGFYEIACGAVYNSALYLHVDGRRAKITHVHRKLFLPTYGVFDEARFIERGRRLDAFETGYGSAALLICEDAWHSICATIVSIKGAEVIFVPSASPGRGMESSGEIASVERWHDLLRATASEHGVYIVYAGLTGFEGGKGMSGASCIVAPDGSIVVRAPSLGACIIVGTLDPERIDIARAALPLLGNLGAVLPDLLLDPQLMQVALAGGPAVTVGR